MKSTSNSSLIYIALSILMCSNSRSIVPEILYIMSPQQLLKFISMYAGETIRIPTLEEFNDDLKAGMAAYYFFIEGKDFIWIFNELNIENGKKRIALDLIRSWINDSKPEEKELLFSMWNK